MHSGELQYIWKYLKCVYTVEKWSWRIVSANVRLYVQHEQYMYIWLCSVNICLTRTYSSYIPALLLISYVK